MSRLAAQAIVHEPAVAGGTAARDAQGAGARLSGRVDALLVGAVVLVVALGWVMVTSASVSIAGRELDDPLFYARRQGLYLLVALGAMICILRTPLAVWRTYSPLLLGLSTVLLALVLVPGIGKEVNGSTRWINLGFTNLQPSELVKVAAALYLSGYLVRQAEEVRRSTLGFLKPVALLGIIAVLLLLEPDYGATVVLFTMALGMLFLGGVPIVSFGAWLMVVVAAMGTLVISAPYRMQRLFSFMDPWDDPFGSGFQLTQALIAIGRGEWFGVGLGASVQKLFYLPEAHTDFLFAVLAEELGLFGAATIIIAFALITWRSILVGRNAEAVGESFGAYLAYGLGLLIGLQAYVNIGVNLGLLPTKGLTLPLMSYGGSSLVCSAAAIALILRVDYETRSRL